MSENFDSSIEAGRQRKDCYTRICACMHNLISHAVSGRCIAIGCVCEEFREVESSAAIDAEEAPSAEDYARARELKNLEMLDAVQLRRAYTNLTAEYYRVCRLVVRFRSQSSGDFNEGIDAAAAFLRSKYGVQGWDCLDFARALHDLKRFPEAPNGG